MEYYFTLHYKRDFTLRKQKSDIKTGNKIEWSFSLVKLPKKDAVNTHTYGGWKVGKGYPWE